MVNENIKLAFTISLDIDDPTFFYEENIDWYAWEQSLASMIRPHDHDVIMHVPRWYLGISQLAQAIANKNPQDLVALEEKIAQLLKADSPVGGEGGLHNVLRTGTRFPYQGARDVPVMFPFVLEGNKFAIEDCYRMTAKDLGLSRDVSNPLLGRLHPLMQKHIEEVLNYDLTGEVQFYCLERASFVKIIQDVIAKRFYSSD